MFDRTIRGPVRAAVAAVGVTTALVAAGCGDGDSASGDTTEATDADGSSSAASAYPVTVESCGVDYTFEGPPEQVLVGWPDSIETLMALGVEDSVVGYLSGELSGLPEGAPDVPEVSPDFAASREVVVAAGADLLLLNDISAVSGESGAVALDDLEAAGTDVFVLGDYCGESAPTTMDVILDDVRDLGAIFGVPDRADELVGEIEQRLADAAVADGQSTAFVQVYDGTLYALSGSSYAAVLDAVGLDNVFDEVDGNFSEISAEEVLTLAPEVIVVVHDETTTDAAEATAEISELLPEAPAVADGSIITISYSAMSASGTTLVDVVEDVAAGV